MMTVFKENKLKIIYLIIFTITDVTVETLFHPQSFTNFLDHFIDGFQFYRFGTSLSDLWIFSLVRMSITFGALVGILRNPDVGIERVGKMWLVVMVLTVLMWSLPVIKMLIFSEHPLFPHTPMFWVTFSWSMVAAVLLMVNWNMLGNLKLSKPAVGKSRISERSDEFNSSDPERQPLLINEVPEEHEAASGEMDQSGEKNGQEKDEPEKPTTKKKASMILRLLAYSKPDWPVLLTAFVFLVISSVAEIFIPWFTGQVIGGIAIDRDQSKFSHAILVMAVLCAGSAFAAGIRGGCFSLCIARLNIRIRNKLFARILQQEIGFFDVTQTGDITSRLTQDASTMSDTLSHNTNVFLRSVISAIGVCVFMFRLSWRLSMVTVLGLPIITGFSKLYGAYYEKLAEKVQDSLAKVNEVADEVCSSMRTVRSFANEGDEIRRYEDKLAVTYGLRKKESIAYAGYMWCSEWFSLSLVVATLYYGGHLVVNNLMSGIHLLSFILYQMNLGYNLENMAAVYTGLMQAAGASIKVFEFIDRNPVVQNTGKLQPDTLTGCVEFKDVIFAYPSRPDSIVLNGVSFKVSPGEVVALVGPSGGGKSSCVSLLEHFYETQGGTVLLDGIPIQEYDHHYLHEKIALVGQEPVLYARSIKDNISYGLMSPDMEQIENAAQMANAHQFIMEMNNKYETETGEKGLQLSGGQKQRVAIARAVIRNPAILILDEATSALDAESEHVVQEAMYNNLKGRTVILIAHRLSTVERADRIIVINKGCVIEEGTHTELLQRGELYAKLVQRQLLGLNAVIQNSDNPPQHDLTNPKHDQPASHTRSCDRPIHGSFKSICDEITQGCGVESLTHAAEIIGTPPAKFSSLSNSPLC